MTPSRTPHSDTDRSRSFSRWRRVVILAAALGLAPFAPFATSFGGGMATAEAQGARPEAVRADVLVVLAREAAGEIDPALNNIAALRRPPFDDFRSMQVLDRPSLRLRPQQDADVALPNGRRLRIRVESQTSDGRYRVRVSINRPNQSDYLPLLQVLASPGDPFFVAGQSHEGGTLVIGITLR